MDLPQIYADNADQITISSNPSLSISSNPRLSALICGQVVFAANFPWLMNRWRLWAAWRC